MYVSDKITKRQSSFDLFSYALKKKTRESKSAKEDLVVLRVHREDRREPLTYSEGELMSQHKSLKS